MKKVKFLALAASFALALVLTFSACPAEAQSSNNEKKLLGTWVREDPKRGKVSEWTFNPDGTGTQKGNSNYGDTFKYVIISNKLAIDIDNKYMNDGALVYDLFISSDGKSAILANGDFGHGVILRKKN